MGNNVFRRNKQTAKSTPCRDLFSECVCDGFCHLIIHIKRDGVPDKKVTWRRNSEGRNQYMTLVLKNCLDYTYEPSKAQWLLYVTLHSAMWSVCVLFWFSE